MADPSRERGQEAGAARGRATIHARAARPPRAANDNTFSAQKFVLRLLPLMAAVAFLCWALFNAFHLR